MARDSQHQSLIFRPSEIEHHYGQNVHLISSPLMLSFLSKLGSPDTHQPQINNLVEMLYSHLVDHVIDTIFPRKKVNINTSSSIQCYFAEIITPFLLTSYRIKTLM